MAELNVSQKGGRKRAALRVDLTAMVDLAFLLVTFFMLTTTLSKPKVMEIGMPVGDDPGEVSDLRSITLCLGSHNQVFLYRGLLDRPVEPPQVLNLGKKEFRNMLLILKQKVKQTTGKGSIVMIKPAPHSNYGNLVNTIDELNITQNITYAIEKINPKEASELKTRHID